MFIIIDGKEKKEVKLNPEQFEMLQEPIALYVEHIKRMDEQLGVNTKSISSEGSIQRICGAVSPITGAGTSILHRYGWFNHPDLSESDKPNSLYGISALIANNCGKDSYGEITISRAVTNRSLSQNPLRLSKNKVTLKEELEIRYLDHHYDPKDMEIIGLKIQKGDDLPNLDRIARFLKLAHEPGWLAKSKKVIVSSINDPFHDTFLS